MIKQKTYNGYRLAGYDSRRPVQYYIRWMLVWDKTGWTTPVRRVVVSFNGKFVDSSGVEWDYGSELPNLVETTPEATKLMNQWNLVPSNILDRYSA